MVEDAVGAVVLSPVLASLRRRALDGSVNIVYYHYVGPVVPYYAEYDVGCMLERFADDLELLSRHFRFVPLDDAIADRAKRGGKPPLAVTFDDGFDLIRGGVADVLEEHGVRATSFVVTACIDNEHLMWRNRLSAIRALADPDAVAAHAGALFDLRARDLGAASLEWPTACKEELVDALWHACGLPPLEELLSRWRPYFTWSGLEEWLARGHDVGLHTRTHPLCSRLDDEGVRAEIVEPAALLRERLGLRSVPFSYPFGRRLPAAAERNLFEEGVVSCALGIDGFAPAGTPPYRLERACAEQGLGYSVFATALAVRLGNSRRTAVEATATAE